MSYQQRNIKKANFLLTRFMGRAKAYPSASLYRRWIKEFPDYKLAFQERKMTTTSTSASSGGGYIPHIISSKKRQSKNLSAVLEYKELFVTKMHKGPTIDELGSLIAYATLHRYMNPQLEVPSIPRPATKIVKPPPLPPPPTKKQRLNKTPPPIIIQMPELSDDEDWEQYA